MSPRCSSLAFDFLHVADSTSLFAARSSNLNRQEKPEQGIERGAQQCRRDPACIRAPISAEAPGRMDGDGWGASHDAAVAILQDSPMQRMMLPNQIPATNDNTTGIDTTLGENSKSDIEMGEARQPLDNPRAPPKLKKYGVAALAVARQVAIGKKAAARKVAVGKNKQPVALDNEWDVFLSYRVMSDSKLVESIYWQLCATDIVDRGSTRRLRVFWDKGAFSCSAHASS